MGGEQMESIMPKEHQLTDTVHTMVFFTTTELARVLHVAPRTITRMVESGELRGSKIGGHVRFSGKSVRAMLDAAKVSATSTSDQIGDDWLTPDQVAKMLGKHRETVLRWCRTKSIPFYRIGAKTLRFRRSEIEGG